MYGTLVAETTDGRERRATGPKEEVFYTIWKLFRLFIEEVGVLVLLFANKFAPAECWLV